MGELDERQPPVKVTKAIAEVLGFDWTRFYDDEQAATKESA